MSKGNDVSTLAKNLIRKQAGCNDHVTFAVVGPVANSSSDEDYYEEEQERSGFATFNESLWNSSDIFTV